MEAIRDQFSSDFWKMHSDFKTSDITNNDETGIYFDSALRKCWFEKGAGNLRVLEMERHSARMTAVLAVQAGGKVSFAIVFASSC